MKIIPVIDILNGLAVHAVRGEREKYKPLKSVLCTSSDPVEVAVAFSRLGFGELYVADLDAISGKPPSLEILKQIVNVARIEMMVDAGIADLKRAGKLLAIGASKVVVGTETLRRKSFVEEAVSRFGADQIVVSLDLRNGLVLKGFDLGTLIEPIKLLKEFQRMGGNRFIVLDLARVGSGEGVDLQFLKRVLSEVEVEVFVGGGVRNVDELVELKRLGVSGVLMATALHSGQISIDNLRSAGMNLA